MNFIKSITLTLATRIIGLFGGILSSVILARALKPEGRGIYALLTLIPATVLIFTSFNIGAANVYYINKKSISLKEAIQTSLFLFTAIGIISFVISIVLFIVWPDATTKSLQLNYIIIASLLVFANLFSGYFNSIILAFQRMVRYNLVSLITTFINVVLLFFFLYKLKGGVLGALVVALFGGILGCIITWKNLKGLASNHLNKAENFKNNIIENIKRLLWYGSRSNLNNILWYLILRSDMFLISAYLGTEALGFYAIAVGISENLRMIPITMGTVLFPKASAMHEKERFNFIIKVTKYTFWIVLLLALPLILGGDIAIRILFSESFLPATNAFRILVVATVILSIANVLGYEFVTSGKPEINAYFNAAGLVINLVLNFILIPKFGIEGAAIASLLAYTVISILIILTVSKIQSINLFKFLILQKEDWIYAKSIFNNFVAVNFSNAK